MVGVGGCRVREKASRSATIVVLIYTFVSKAGGTFCVWIIANSCPRTIANATVDRLLHHTHVVTTAGDSIRLTQATAGKGVTPLTS